MSWLRRFFAGNRSKTELNAANPTSAEPVVVKSYGGRIVHVPALNMMGQQAKSPSGRYELIWQDSARSADALDVRGRYVLIDGGKVVIDGRMARPQAGKVSDAGRFILNDWGARDELAGIFSAFAADGRQIVSRNYSANLLNNGLSSDGNLAICQTCNAPGSPDSSMLEIFDLEAGTSVARWAAESGWADGYEFPEGSGSVRMIRRDKPSLEYTLQGEFLDRIVWLRDEIARGNVFVIRKALKEGPDAHGITLDDFAAGTRAALADEDQRFRADALRLIGEIEEQAGNPLAALNAYDEALSLNPKIGVANRAAALRRSHEH